ncbi:MmgE/PrpD family protein [Paraburkholderia megapolitana]|nr:MmgE/PrpD family protein [Paraburkholderia megapolitana]
MKIATFANGFDPARIDGDHYRLCARSFADTFACAVAGRNEPASRAALRYLEHAGLVDVDVSSMQGSRAHLWGQPATASAEAAAFYNGVAGHVLDYDDVTVPLRGHPSVVLWPALMALAEAEDLSGERLASAYAVGFEALCRLARVIAAAQYEKGWHCTATLGAVAATVACGHLLRLDEAQIVHAIGLAVAQSSGVRANVGSDAKSFQAGQASAAAVRAALLAQAGFCASADALDGPHGYANLYAHGEDIGAALHALGPDARELERSGLDVKQYPMCYATHRVLDGLLAFRRERGVTLADVERVSIYTSRAALIPLTHHRPKTGLEGKFSLEYAVAAALADGHIRLATFTDEAVNRPHIQQFFECVDASDGDTPMLPRRADITLTLRNGTCERRSIETLHGSTQDPLTDDELTAKLADCLDWAGSHIDPQRLFSLALDLRSLRTRDLFNAFESPTH